MLLGFKIHDVNFRVQIHDCFLLTYTILIKLNEKTKLF